METDARVRRLIVYPIKSLDGTDVSRAIVLPSGALKHDREFALFDGQGNVVNGKRESRLHAIRATYDLAAFRVTLRAPGTNAATFHLTAESNAIESWIGAFLGIPVTLGRDTETGFPDDLESPGPTIASSNSLDAVASWFGWTEGGEASRRFRTNIEIDADSPFWEDRLFGDGPETVEFTVGDVRVLGVNPCQRCAVPSRDPDTGEASVSFQKGFAEKRAATLPPWASTARFNHYYRFSVNTRIPVSEAGKAIMIGNAVRLFGD